MAVRKIGLVSRTYRHVNRYRQILTVLFKYGFEELVEQLRIGQYLEIGWKLISRERRPHVEHLTAAERVRMALEELGPTFIKLGQVLSTRPDLVPAKLATELSKLQQHVPPFPFGQVRATIERELGRPLNEVFERLEHESLAAGSIGQVHRARLLDGEEVVVKVRRPDIESVVEVDLEILLHLATLVEKHLEDWRMYRPRRIVEEFSRVIWRELNFRVEAAHLERFAANFHDDETVYVPKVFREVSTEHVLTLEYVDVTPTNDLAALAKGGFDRRLIAARGAEITLRQIFAHGFFHADPHPGNVFVLPGNVVCFLDFGMMGRVTREERENMADLLHAVAGRDTDQATLALLHLTTSDDELEPDRGRVEVDVAQFIDVHVPETIGQLDFGRLMHELLDLVHRHHLLIPADLVMMLKAAATAERMVVGLDPDLNMIAAVAPYVRRLKLDRVRPRRLWRDLVDSGGELLHLAREIPGGFRDLLRVSKRGQLKLGLEHRGLEDMLETHERVANRVSFAIVAAALIVGSSLIVHSRIPPMWGEVPIIGLIGFLAAGAMGFMLLVSILRHGKL